MSLDLALRDFEARARAWRDLADRLRPYVEADTSPPEHLLMEVFAVRHRGQLLRAGEQPPGCGCPGCTGIPADHPARLPAAARRRRRSA